MKEQIKTIYLLLDNYDRRDVHGMLWEFIEEMLEYAPEKYRAGLANLAREVPDVITALFELRDLLENYPDDAQTINGRNKNECFHLNNIYLFVYGEKYEEFRKGLIEYYPIYLKSKTAADCRIYGFLDAITFRNHLFKITESVFKLDVIIASGTFKDLEEHYYESDNDNSIK